MFENIKIGDRVWSITKGWGTIEEIRDHVNCRIKVRLDNGWSEDYTADGKALCGDINPSLFWNEIKLDIPERPSLPHLKIDTKVWVWDIEDTDKKFQRHFSHFNEDGKIVCFKDGRTSFTSSDELLWNYWELQIEERPEIIPYWLK